MKTAGNRRILIVDDMPSIHEDFRRILVQDAPPEELIASELILFGAPAVPAPANYELHSAYQGAEALDLVVAAGAQGVPYSVAIVDMRMPPGWDGMETVQRLRQEDAALEIVICTAYSDMSMEEMSRRLGELDRVTLLRKPFEAPHVIELVDSLARKRESSGVVP